VIDSDYVEFHVDPATPDLREIIFRGHSLIVKNADLNAAADDLSGYADRAGSRWARARNEAAIALIEESIRKRLLPLRIN
jgi:hypothetical protein